MVLPAKRIPGSVAHLDVEIVAAALIRNDANIRQCGARARRSEQRFAQIGVGRSAPGGPALEAVELRLDDAEANLSQALHCGSAAA